MLLLLLLLPLQPPPRRHSDHLLELHPGVQQAWHLLGGQPKPVLLDPPPALGHQLYILYNLSTGEQLLWKEAEEGGSEGHTEGRGGQDEGKEWWEIGEEQTEEATERLG